MGRLFGGAGTLCKKLWGGLQGLRVLAPCARAGGAFWGLGQLLGDAGTLRLCSGRPPLGGTWALCWLFGGAGTPGHALGTLLPPCWGSPLLATPQRPGAPLLGRAPSAPTACSAPPWADTPGPRGTPGSAVGCHCVRPRAGRQGAATTVARCLWEGATGGGHPAPPTHGGAVANPVGCPSLSPGV